MMMDLDIGSTCSSLLDITALRWIHDNNAFINSSHEVAMVRISDRRVWAETRTLTDREV